MKGIKIVGMVGNEVLSDNYQDRSRVTIEFSGTRSGKTASLISTVAYWARSDLPQVILDPSCEIGPMTWRLLTNLGREVRILNPDQNPVDLRGNPVPWRHLIAGYDALGWIDVHKPGASSHIRSFGRYFVDDDGVKEDGTSGYFRKAARNLITCILAHILWDEGPCPAPKTLATMREIISLDADEITNYLTTVRMDSRSSMARQLAGRLVKLGEKAPKTFENMVDEANQATAWLTDPELAALVSGGDFQANDITVRKPVTVIVQVPMDTLITDPCIARVIFGSFFSAKVASKTISDTLFIPDEAWLLGKMQALKIALFAGGKHGIVMHMPWQSIGQMEDIWGPSGRKYWLDNAAYILIGKLRDPNVAKEISEVIGTMPVIAYSEGDNRGVQGGTGLWSRISRGRNVNRHEIKRAVRMVSEVISDLKRDEVFLIGLDKPAQIKRPLWFRIPWLADEIEPSPYQQDEMEEAA